LDKLRKILLQEKTIIMKTTNCIN